MKLLTLIIVPLLLSACADFSAVRQAAHDKGARVMDTAVDVSVVALCNDYSVGSIIRRFGGSSQTWHAYLVMCNRTTDAQIARPVDQP